MRVFISQPMANLSNQEIWDKQKSIKERLRAMHADPNDAKKLKFINSFIAENAPDGCLQGLWYLGKSFQLLAKADLLVMAEGWENARGCQMEHEAAQVYGIRIVYEENGILRNDDEDRTEYSLSDHASMVDVASQMQRMPY